MPYIHGRTVDIFQKRQNPHIHRAFLNGNEGKSYTEKRAQNGQRPGKEKGKRKVIADQGADCAARQISELFNRHVAYQPELECGNVLWDRMLFHRDFPIQIIVGNVPSLRKDKKRTTIVKTIVFFSRCLLRKLGSTWYHCTMDDFALFQIKNSRESEEPIEAMEQIFSALGAHRKRSVFSRLFGPKQPAKYFSFEIVAAGEQSISFLVVPEPLFHPWKASWLPSTRNFPWFLLRIMSPDG